MRQIRMLDNLSHNDENVSKNDVLTVGTGKNTDEKTYVDKKTADAWVRAGLAMEAVDMEHVAAPVASHSKVVVHERGGMELLQAATTIDPSGKRRGPAAENPTDSDVETDTDAGASRTAAGAVIAENADPDAVI